MPWWHSTTSSTGALGGVMILPGAFRFVVAELTGAAATNRNDPAWRIPVCGRGAGELRYLHVLRAVGADREGGAIRDVLDIVAIGVDLELVIAGGVPGLAVRRRGIHPEDRARAAPVARSSKTGGVADIHSFVCCVVKTARKY